MSERITPEKTPPPLKNGEPLELFRIYALAKEEDDIIVLRIEHNNTRTEHEVSDLFLALQGIAGTLKSRAVESDVAIEDMVREIKNTLNL